MTTNAPPRATRLWRDPLAWAVTVLTLGLSLAILFDLTPLLRGPLPSPPEWQWRAVSPPALRWAVLPLPLAVALLIGAWAALTQQQARLRLHALLILAGLALALRLAVLAAAPGGLSIVARTLNPSYFGYFPPATEVESLPQFLRTFTERQPELSVRLATHPPGNVVFYWIILRAADALPFLSSLAAPLVEPRLAALPAWAADYTIPEIVAGAAASLIVPALSTLAILPLYGLARRLSGERAARLAALLAVFIPALTLFTPVIDDLYTLITALMMWLIVIGTLDRKRGLIALGGLVWGLGMFLSFGLLPLLLIAGLFAAAHHLLSGPGRRWRDLLLDGLALGAGGLAVWALAWALFGLNPLAVYRSAMGAHGGLTETRSYWWSLLYNPYDVLLFAGVPLAFHVVRGAIRAARRAARRSVDAADQLLLAIVLTLLALFAAGTVRGETARIMLYVMPLLAWAAAHDISRETVRPRGSGTLLAALLLAQTLIFQAALSVYH